MKQNLSDFLSCHQPGFLLEIGSLDFPEFWRGARSPYEVMWQNESLWEKTFFVPNIGEKGQKQSFLDVKKNWVIDFYG